MFLWRWGRRTLPTAAVTVFFSLEEKYQGTLDGVAGIQLIGLQSAGFSSGLSRVISAASGPGDLTVVDNPCQSWFCLFEPTAGEKEAGGLQQYGPFS